MGFASTVLAPTGNASSAAHTYHPLDLYLASPALSWREWPPERDCDLWVVDDADPRPSATVLLEEILAWVDTWGFAPVVVRALPNERGSLAAVEELGLAEIPARHQELPYRWFRG